MKASCTRIGEGLKCLRAKTKCYPVLTRRALMSYVGSRSRHSRRLCSTSNGNNTLAFIKSSLCVQKQGVLPRLVLAERNFTGILTMLANVSMKWEDKFHAACCSALAYRDSLLRDIGEVCPGDIGPQEEFQNSMVGELVDSICPDANRLNEICLKIPKITLPDRKISTSLPAATLELVEVLAREE